ncbi:hypothetical protein HPB47_018357, partial [Ixodes persulcatus]
MRHRRKVGFSNPSQDGATGRGGIWDAGRSKEPQGGKREREREREEERGREATVIGPCSHVVRARLLWPSLPASLAREQTPPAPLGCCGCHASPAKPQQPKGAGGVCSRARLAGGDGQNSRARHQPARELRRLQRSFYQEFVVMTPAAAAIREQETRSQSTSLWHSSRRLRLTASTAKQVPVLSKTSCEKSVASLVCPTLAGNASTRHGQRYEPVARALLSHDYHLAVTRCGTFVCNDLPWISASPGGMIYELDAILEIKCPNTDDCLSTLAKYDLKHLTGDEYELVEKGSKKFYVQ